MVELMEKAWAEIAKLPEQEQEAFAAWILERIASEKNWDQAFADSSDKLAELGKKALDEHHARLTKPLDPDMQGNSIAGSV